MKPEAKVEIFLWDWLKIKGRYVEEVYFNRETEEVKEVKGKIFRIEGDTKKPDLIIKLNKGYGNEYYAVEVKDNSQSINVLKGSKIIDLYFKNYASNKTKYFINTEEIKIKGFLLATQSSIRGYLYNQEDIKDNWKADKNSSRYKVSKEYKIIPRKEGSRTFDFIRQLWSEYGKIRNNYDIKCSLGIIIANSENKFRPAMMITNYSEKNKKWGQKWWKI